MPVNLLHIAQSEGIEVRYMNLAPPIDIEGCYFASSGRPHFIGLAKQLEDNLPYLRCVFAEELGHHFTSTGIAIPHSHYRYSRRLNINRTEYKALQWAAKLLMPLEEIREALCEGICEDWQLADHFIVTKEMVHFRFQLADIKNKLFNRCYDYYKTYL